MMECLKVVLREASLLAIIISLFVVEINAAGGVGDVNEKEQHVSTNEKDLPSSEDDPIRARPSTEPNAETLSEDMKTLTLSAEKEDVHVSSSRRETAIKENDRSESGDSLSPSEGSRFEVAIRASLAPLNAITNYAKGKRSIFSDFSVPYKTNICQLFRDAYPSLIPNVNPRNSYIFGPHLYEFELLNGESSEFSVAIQCPTIPAYPLVFLRVSPVTSAEISLVIVPHPLPPSTQPYVYSLSVAKSIEPVIKKDAAEEKILLEHFIFKYNPEDLSYLCESAHARFKYGLLMSLENRMVGEPGMYEIEYENEKRIYPTVKCGCSPLMYLVFDDVNSDIKITFRDTIEELIERKYLLSKFDLRNFA